MTILGTYLDYLLFKFNKNQIRFNLFVFCIINGLKKG